MAAAKPFRSKKCLRRTRSPIFQQYLQLADISAMDTIGTAPAYSCRFCDLFPHFLRVPFHEVLDNIDILRPFAERRTSIGKNVSR